MNSVSKNCSAPNTVVFVDKEGVETELIRQTNYGYLKLLGMCKGELGLSEEDDLAGASFIDWLISKGYYKIK